MTWLGSMYTCIPSLLRLPPAPCIDPTCIPCIGRGFRYHWATRGDPRSVSEFVDSKDSEAAWVGKGFFQPSCVTKFPDQGLNPNPLQQKHRVLTAGLPKKSWQRVYHQSLESHFFSFWKVHPEVFSPEKGRLIMPFILLLRGILLNPLSWKERKKKNGRGTIANFKMAWPLLHPEATGFVHPTYRKRSSQNNTLGKVCPWGERSDYHQKTSDRFFYF